MELADELGWAFVNITLRPFYAEGSKTLAFEIAERLGWRLPDAVVAPIASGSLFTKVAKGFDELVKVGLVEPKTIKFIGGQAAGGSPVASAPSTAGSRHEHGPHPAGPPVRDGWPEAGRRRRRYSWERDRLPDDDLPGPGTAAPRCERRAEPVRQRLPQRHGRPPSPG